MYMKFIGQDGSMGLRLGKVYKTRIYSNDGLIFVQWNSGCCPYSSPQSLAANWKRWDM